MKDMIMSRGKFKLHLISEVIALKKLKMSINMTESKQPVSRHVRSKLMFYMIQITQQLHCDLNALIV